MSILSFSSQKSTAKSSVLLRMNLVNLVNLPGPYCICLVKKGQKRGFLRKNREFLIKITKQMGYPIPKFTKFTEFIKWFLAVFDDFLPFIKKMMKKVAENSRFFLNSDVLSEYLCICSGSKVVFCHGIRNGSVNFVNLGIFEVHRDAMTQRKRKRRKEKIGKCGQENEKCMR